VGWYVWHSKQETDKILSSNPSDVTVPQIQKADWYLFTSDKGGYNMRLPDGWNFIQDTGVGSLYNDRADSTSAVSKKGTAATVKNVTEGVDEFGSLTFYATMLSSRSLADMDLESFTKGEPITTKSGLKVDVYTYEDNAAKQQEYLVRKRDSALLIRYMQFDGAADQTDTVVKAVKSVSLN
jgi:hypothetical protein